MKSILTGILVAFSLYSAIPVPQVEWKKNTMRIALVFLPFVGIIIGVIEWIFYLFCVKFSISSLFYSIIASVIPIIISGGIHLDGLCDTCDALCSFGSTEKKLEILKDPHIGAFGVIWLIVYFALNVAFFSEIYSSSDFMIPVFFAYAIARTGGACKIIHMKCAKNSGLAHIFAENSDKKTVLFALVCEFILLMIAMFLICKSAFIIVPLVSVFIWYLYHNKICNVFGGITGDLAGFYICVCELIFVALSAVGGIIL